MADVDTNPGQGPGTPEGQAPEGTQGTPRENEEGRAYTAADMQKVREEAAARRRELREAEKEREDLKKRLQEMEDERKPELQRLQERAEAATRFETEAGEWKTRAEAAEAALTAEVERQRKALEGLDKDMLDLMPAGSPVEQLGWLSRAVTKAQKDAEKRGGGLPPSGGRNPGQNGKTEPTAEEQAAARQDLMRRW